MRLKVQQLLDGTTEVDVKTLPDGRTCIHWLQECDDGPIAIQGHAQLRGLQGRPEVGRYRVACRPQQKTVESQKRGSVRYMCMTSGDIAAVTCPACIASDALQNALVEQIESKDEGAAKAALSVLQAIDGGK